MSDDPLNEWGENQDEAASRRAAQEKYNNDWVDQSREQSSNNSGAGCIVILLAFTGILLTSSYGVYQLFC